MPMVWQDMSNLNRKYNAAWLAGLGGGVFDGGSVLTPARPRRSVGAAPPGGETFWWNIQVNINDHLAQLDREEVEVTEKPDVPTCAALQWLLEHMPSDAYFREFVEEPENRKLIDEGCRSATEGMETLPVPKSTSSSAEPEEQPQDEEQDPVEQPVVSACDGGRCDCYVHENDSGDHIAFLQEELNEALADAGFEPISVTGVYDAATCGAVFELGGSFRPSYPDLCTNPEGEWIVPLECPEMVMPKKSSRASMFAVGGLVLAAGLGAAYWVSKR